MPTFARLDAFAPRVSKIRVAGIAALLEPRTAASATRELARLFGRGTFRARKNRRRFGHWRGWRLRVDMGMT